MTYRQRQRVHAILWGLVLVPLAPMLLPLLGTTIWLDNIGRRQEAPRARRGYFIWRLWWWYGYHGLYWVNWRWKHWKQRHSWARCVRGNWTLEVEDGTVECWRGERCVREVLHLGAHRMALDWNIVTKSGPLREGA